MTKRAGRRYRVQVEFLAETDAQLARVLGVTPQAIAQTAGAERIRRTPDGWWDVFGVVEAWRVNTTLSRPPARARWLHADVPLTLRHVAELVKRARAEGVMERVWPADGDPRCLDLADLIAVPDT